VLAAVEADARRTEAALLSPTGAAAEQDEARVPTEGVPADWQLPGPPELPPLETMPPVPPELSERILDLRSQIMSLQGELATAMQEVSTEMQRTSVPTISVGAPVETPALIDRRL
jgi:hypothetical protein